MCHYKCNRKGISIVFLLLLMPSKQIKKKGKIFFVSIYFIRRVSWLNVNKTRRQGKHVTFIRQSLMCNFSSRHNECARKFPSNAFRFSIDTFWICEWKIKFSLSLQRVVKEKSRRKKSGRLKKFFLLLFNKVKDL